MKRVELSPPKRGFTKGHRLSVGNKGNTAESRANKRFMSQALIAGLLKIVEDKKGNKSRRVDRIIESLLTNAENGDNVAVNSIFNRVEGMPKQTTEVNANINARVVAAQITKEMSPAEASRLYVQSLNAPEPEADDGGNDE